MRKFLKGKKAYIFAALMAIRGIIEVITGDITISQFVAGPYIQEILTAGLGASIRAGIAKGK